MRYPEVNNSPNLIVKWYKVTNSRGIPVRIMRLVEKDKALCQSKAKVEAIVPLNRLVLLNDKEVKHGKDKK